MFFPLEKVRSIKDAQDFKVGSLTCEVFCWAKVWNHPPSNTVQGSAGFQFFSTTSLRFFCATSWSFRRLEVFGGDDMPRTVCLPNGWSAPTIAADGTVFVGSEEGPMFALRDEDSDGRDSWPSRSAKWDISGFSIVKYSYCGRRLEPGNIL